MAVRTNVKVILRTVAAEIGWNDVSMKHRLVVTQKLAQDVASTTCGSKKKNAGTRQYNKTFVHATPEISSYSFWTF